MDNLTTYDLVKAGFTQETAKQWKDANKFFDLVPTDTYKLRSFNPEPEVQFSALGSSAKIGSMYWKLRTTADLQNFTQKIIPTFCDYK